MSGELRPKGTVELLCHNCDFLFWVDALSPKLKELFPFCPSCSGEDKGHKADTTRRGR